MRSFVVAVGALLLCVGQPGATAWAQATEDPVRTLFRLPDAADRPAHAATQLPDGLPPAVDEPDLAAMRGAQLNLLDELPPEAWERDALAESIGPEPASAFEFVRDHIAFDPYSGVLRGVQGALAARAANSWDRALLLRALLDHHGHVTRLAFGDLDDAAIDKLLAAAVDGAVSALDPPDLTTKVTTFDLQALADRARRDHALLTQALDAADMLDVLGRTDEPGARRAEAVVPDLRAAVRSHAWVQVEQGDGSWLDLDTSLPGAVPGAVLTAAAGSTDEVPEDAQHSVVVRVLVETLADGELEESVSLEVPFTTIDAAGSELWLLFRPEEASGGVGLFGSSGGKNWQPVFLVDEEALAGTPFPLSSSGGGGGFGGLLGGGGGGGAQVTRVTLQLVARSPDGTERTAERTLLDRVDPRERQAGEVSAGSLTALPSSGPPPELGALHNIVFSNGGMSPREQIRSRMAAIYYVNEFLRAKETEETPSEQPLLRALAVVDNELVLASERVAVAGLSGPGMRAFVGGARSFLVSFGATPELEGGVDSTIDLALDGVALVGSDASAEAQARLWYGVLETALETQAMQRRWRGFGETYAELDSVSLRMGEQLAALTPAAVADVPVDAVEMASVLQSGEVVVSVGAPGPGGAFWAVEVGTGATRSVLEPGVRASRGRVGDYYRGPSYRRVKVWDIDPPDPPDPPVPPPSKCAGNEYLIMNQCVSLRRIFVGTLLGSGVIAGTMFVIWALD
ncbi:MAG: hypothetical protein H3C53_06585 [Trueperaceae bacterium]|nr:hypothetical protein [Trueperaceae bacterium]